MNKLKGMHMISLKKRKRLPDFMMEEKQRRSGLGGGGFAGSLEDEAVKPGVGLEALRCT